MKKLPRSVRKYIRREKTRIRLEIFDIGEQKKLIEELYARFMPHKEKAVGEKLLGEKFGEKKIEGIKIKKNVPVKYRSSPKKQKGQKAKKELRGVLAKTRRKKTKKPAYK